MTVCKRVVYSGHVQGVGFRHTARWLAAGFSVAGFVRNLPSGEVELVAEGEENVVEAYLAELAQRMAGYIGNKTVQDVAPTGECDFRIRN